MKFWKILLVSAVLVAVISQSLRIRTSQPASAQAQTETQTNVYLPLLQKNFPHFGPFGFSNGTFSDQSFQARYGSELGVTWYRLVNRVDWRDLQPVENGPILWEKLGALEDELRMVKDMGLTPILVMHESPDWAASTPIACSPILPDKLDDFAEFMRQLVAHLSQPEFSVHNWELGNEPDIDPDLFDENELYGCWGDMDDPVYYGGDYYGQMLKTVGQAIKQTDPHAKVWMGGLLLDTIHPPDYTGVRMENFFKGVLASGAADVLDFVSYHWYAVYYDVTADYEYSNVLWNPWGGGLVGKARYMQSIMDAYGVDIPIVVNEVSLSCPGPDDHNSLEWCDPPDEGYRQNKANFLVRSFVRGLAEGVDGYIWFTLEYPGWRNGGLVTEEGPFPAYYAYQELASRLNTANFLYEVTSYTDGIEAYAFASDYRIVHVLWARQDTTIQVQVPAGELLHAYSRNGAELSLTEVNGYYPVEVGFSPIYLVYNR